MKSAITYWKTENVFLVELILSHCHQLLFVEHCSLVTVSAVKWPRLVNHFMTERFSVIVFRGNTHTILPENVQMSAILEKCYVGDGRAEQEKEIQLLS